MKFQRILHVHQLPITLVISTHQVTKLFTIVKMNTLIFSLLVTDAYHVRI